MRTPVVFFSLSLCAAACDRPPTAADAARGRAAVAARGCGACHSIEGVENAVGVAAPSLNGIARREIIAGRLPNTRDNVIRWIIDPGSIEPGVAMPPLIPADTSVARDIVAYLYSLK